MSSSNPRARHSSTLDDIRRAFRLLPPEARRRFLWIGLLAVVASALEATGVTVAFGLIRVIVEPKVLDGNAFFEPVRAFLDLQTGSEFFIFAALSMSGFFLIKNLFLGFATFVQQRFALTTSALIARDLLERYLRAPYARIFDRNSADLIVAVNQSSYIISTRIFAPSVVVMTEALVIAGVLSVLLFAEPATTIVAMLFLGTLMIGYNLVTGRFYTRWGREQLQLERDQTKFIVESLNSLKEVKVLGCEQYFIDNFVALRRKIVKLGTWVGTANVMPRLFTETILIFAIALVIVIVMAEGREQVSIISMLGLFAFAGFRIMPSMNRISLALTSLKHGKSALDQVTGDVRHFDIVAAPKTAAAEPAAPLHFTRSLSAENLIYTYPGAAAASISAINFEIERGQAIGVVGGTGAGKTTLINLLLGLLEPDSGTLRLDGTPLDTKSAGWKALVGYVPQDIALIDNTVRRNIALGVPSADIDDERLGRVIRLAALEAVVNDLPDGVETVIGERGIRFSGGQRQRIGIARALYRDPDLLIMDESTSALDTETEREIIDAIETLKGDKTTITIAHRLSTVRHCQQIFLMEGGRIVDIGTFDELWSRNAAFARMVELAELMRGSLDGPS